jgi:hypothetical protein
LKELFIDLFLPFISEEYGISKENIGVIDTTVKRTQERRMDFACRVLGNEDYIIQIEFQTKNDTLIHYRMLDYYEVLARSENLSVKQLLIYVGKEKMTMKNSIEHPILNFNFKIANLSEINYHELLDSNLPESVMLAILGDFQNENPEQVISTILNRLHTVVKDDTFLQKCFFRLEILSELRNLESETVKQIRNMPITGIDIRKTYFYKEVQRLNREDDLKEGRKEGIEMTAINLLKKGMTIEFVCECTGLSKLKVKELQKKI